MNKKEFLRGLKPGRWVEIKIGDKVSVALALKKPCDMGAGFHASCWVFVNNVPLTIRHQDAIQILGELQVPETSATMRQRDERQAAEAAALRMRIALRNACSDVAPKKPKKRTDPKLVCEEKP